MFRRLQTLLKDYFTFTTRERRGIIVLLTVLLLVMVTPYVWNKVFPPKLKPVSEFDEQITFVKDNTVVVDRSDSANQPTNGKSESFTIEINSADSNSFKQVKGIKPYLAARIIKFRRALGGFYSVAQLKEVYGLKPGIVDSNMQHFTVNASAIKTININTAGNDELKHHPYIGYSLAKVIIAYRTEHGNFITVADIKNIAIVTDDIYSKLLPYLRVK